MSFPVTFTIYMTLLGVFWFFVGSVLWHLKEYTMPDDYSSLIVKIFIIIIALLNLLGLVLFFRIPLQ